MGLLTKANGNSNWTMSLYYCSNENFIDNVNSSNRFKIIIVREGNGIIKINNRRKIFFSSCIFILNEKDVVTVEKMNNVKASAIYFHPEVINSKINFVNVRDRNGDLSLTDIQDIALLTAFISSGDSIEIGPQTYKHLEDILINIKKETELQGHRYWPCRVRSYLIEILIYIERIMSKNNIFQEDITNLKNDEANEVLEYLYNNFQNRIAISDITKELGINKNLVQKYVFSATNLSVMAYLMKLRIQFASILLRDTGIPISEISERSGFMDITSFGRAFKKVSSCTPSEYRNKYNVNCKE